jgi:YidC/Oxa1 family membrane protein insertase
MEKEDQRNFLLAILAMVAFVFLYQIFVMEPAQKRYQAQQAQIAAQKQTAPVDTAAAEAAGPKPLPEALAASPRIALDAPSVDGSIRLAGARLDDLNLKQYFLTAAKEVKLPFPLFVLEVLNVTVAVLVTTNLKSPCIPFAKLLKVSV